MQTNVMYYKDNTNVLLPYSKAPLSRSQDIKMYYTMIAQWHVAILLKFYIDRGISRIF